MAVIYLYSELIQLLKTVLYLKDLYIIFLFFYIYFIS